MILEISQLRTRRSWDVFFFLLLLVVSCSVILVPLFFSATYIIAFGQNIYDSFYRTVTVPVSFIIGWSLAGLVLSFFSMLFAWPLALASAVVLQQEQGKWSVVARQFMIWLSRIPLIVYCYIFLQFIASDILALFKGLWMDSFASINWLTQLLAFTSTVILYPLTIFIPKSEGMTVDMFYRSSLEGIINFGEMGLTLTMLCLGLSFVMLPRMIIEIQSLLKKEEDVQRLEVVRSLGGTLWEAMHITMIHSMKSRFAFIIVRYMRFSFFEGALVFLLLKYLFIDEGVIETFVGSTFSSFSLNEIMVRKLVLGDLLVLGGWLFVIHILFVQIESLFFKGLRNEK